MKRYLILFLLVTFFMKVKAQQFYNHFEGPDTTQKEKIKSDLQLLNYFTRGDIDTLYRLLGSDSNIVHLDTLKKYYKLYQNSYNWTNTDVKNPYKWVQSTSSFYLERTFAGVGKPAEGRMDFDYETVLVMHVDLKMLNGKTTIAKITFAVVPPNEEVQNNFLKLRLKRSEDKQHEQIMEKAKSKIPPPPNLPR